MRRGENTPPEERESGNMAPIALGLSLVFTFLFLTALYESFLTPIAIILSVPLAMIGGLVGLLIRFWLSNSASS